MSKPMHILLVEDDEVDVEHTRRSFSNNQMVSPLYVARNGLDALDQLRGTNGKTQLNPMPSIVLLDIHMPKMNGIEFLEVIRNDPVLQSLIVFVLTGSKEQTNIISAYNKNVVGYISKPINFNVFLETLKKINLYHSLIVQEQILC